MTLIQKTKFKIIVLVVSVMVIVISLVLGSFGFVLYAGTCKDVYLFLNSMVYEMSLPEHQRIHFSPTPTEEFNYIRLQPSFIDPLDGVPQLQPVKKRHAMAVEFSDNFTQVEILFGNLGTMTKETFIYNSQPVIEKGKSKGIYKDYFYLRRNLEDGKVMYCIVDCIIEMRALRNAQRYILITFSLSVLFAFLISLFLSEVLMKPISDTLERHNRFISDSSHELRTPVSVIEANLDVVLSHYPDNKWLRYIKVENEKMGELIKNLLYLSRNDKLKENFVFKQFDLSNAVSGTVLSFEATAYEDNKTIEMYVEKGMFYNGDETSIRQIVRIFMDNAIKYSLPDSKIKIKAYPEKKSFVISVYNTGSSIQKKNLDKVFDRFFREDVSRAKEKSGNGLGLCIAKKLAEVHNGTITAESDGKSWVEFTLRLR